MLRLEKLEISGFKSFLETARLTFPGSITAVIGPNGCGKSNICDAVAWALGEQSARILRGDKMDDVIFNGSGKRRPLGMAEVTLTLRSENGDFPESDGQVAIGRRVYRDGEGEYLLNGRKVRLKDVQDILYGTGLGVRAYAIIEQGKIDQVLSSKPQDRRKLIEEAAGITKYKVRKRSAELKLEETRANMTRLSDIIAEVERACASLKRQASKAERYKEKTAQLRERRTILARLRFDALSQALTQAARELQARRDEEASRAADLAACEAAEAEARRLSIDSRAMREKGREGLTAATSAVERDDAAIEAARRAEIEITARLEALSRDSGELAREALHRAREKEKLEILRRELLKSFEQAGSEKDLAQSVRREREDRLSEQEADVDAGRSSLAEVSMKRAEAGNARHEIDLALERVASSRARLRETRQRIEASLAELDEELRAADFELENLLARAKSALDALSENERSRDATLRKVGLLEETRAGLRENAAAAQELRRSLEERRDSSLAQSEKLVALFGRSSGADLAATWLRPRPGWEGVLDRLLSEELSAVAVDAESSELAARMRAEGLGGAVIGTRGVFEAAREESWSRVLDNFADVPAAIRATLPAVVFVENAQEAAEGARRDPRSVFAARTGEIVRGAFWRVPGARADQAGPLTLRHDLEQLNGRLETLSAEILECEEALSASREERGAQDAEGLVLAEARRNADSELAAHTARFAEKRDAALRQRRELSTLEAEDGMLAAEASTLFERKEETAAAERELFSSEEELRRRIEELTREISARRPELASAVEAESAAREKVEGMRERLAASEREWLTLRAQEEAAARKRGEWERESLALSERRERAGREAEQARERRNINVLARESEARRFEEFSLEAENRAVAATQAEDQVRRVRAIFEAARQLRHEGEVAETRLRADYDHLVEDTRREFSIGPEELPEQSGVSEDERATFEIEAAELADQIEKMGPVNVLAFEEHREQSERLTFLLAQRQDIEASIASLVETIRKINATSSERFAEAFARINENFAELFVRLFRGGSAQMRLLDESDVLDSGIEITAQPPGKRNQSILLLSGGEKAMTAIALLMAIFRYKPSPFCILDEVDAPLDDANIDRFAQLIREMSEETQFIAITHNKRTMEGADSLYGVTMEEAGCSKIVSVKFD
jgi:chromosome segregation protein